MADACIPIEQLTALQLNRLILQRLDAQQPLLERLDRFMADLTSSVSALQGAVDTIAVRFATQLAPLTQALSEAQDALNAATINDDAQNQALADALAAASSAAEAIDAEVAELNAIGAQPDVPVEAVPVEDIPAPPSEDTTDTPAETPADGEVPPNPENPAGGDGTAPTQ